MQGQSRSSSSPQVVGHTSVMAASMPVTSGQRRAAANLITRSCSPHFAAELLQSPFGSACWRHFADVCGGRRCRRPWSAETLRMGGRGTLRT